MARRSPRKKMRDHKKHASDGLSSNTMNDASEFSDFTAVSYARAARGSTTTDTQHYHVTVLTNPVTIHVTPASFANFYQRVYPILQKIAAGVRISSRTPFILKWRKAIKSGIDQDSSLQDVLHALDLRTLFGFKDFIQTAPGIDPYLTFQTQSTATSFLCTCYQQVLITSADDSSNTIINSRIEESKGEAFAENVRTKIDDASKTITSPSEDNSSIMTTTHMESDDAIVMGECYGTNDDFSLMMKQLWPSLTEFVEHQPNHTYTRKLKQWMDDGLTMMTTLSKAKEIFGVQSLDQIFSVLQNSPALAGKYQFVWDHKIIYRRTEQPISSTQSIQSEIPFTPDSEYHSVCQQSAIELSVLHYELFTVIQSCYSTGVSSTDDNESWTKWNNLKLQGLLAIQEFDKVKDILGVSNLSQYITFMTKFDPIQEQFIFKWDSDFKLWYKQSPNSKSDHLTISKELSPTQYEDKLAFFEQKVRSIENKLASNERAISNHFLHYQDKIDKLHQECFTQYITMLEERSIYLQKCYNKGLEQLAMDLQNKHLEAITMAMTKAVDAFKDQLRDDQQHHIKTITDDIEQIMMTYHDQLHDDRKLIEDFMQALPEFRKSQPHSIPRPSSKSPGPSRFPAMHQSSTESSTPTHWNHYTNPTTNADNMHQSSRYSNAFFNGDNTTSHAASVTKDFKYHQHLPKYPAHTHQRQYNIPGIINTMDTGLPYINHDMAIKRAKVQYTGLADTSVFYNQLRNALEQYGIFLISLKDVKRNESLCPPEYNGIPISNQRKQSMGCTLYQKLLDTDVVPLEHRAIRNMIDAEAEENDGYRVLYSMLQLVHPQLQVDKVMRPPRSADCDEDIHSYAQKFNAWYNFETYAGRVYPIQTLINHFLEGLSSLYKPAIDRVRQMLDNVEEYSSTVPYKITIPQLPNTMERFMEDANGQSLAMICAINKRKLHPSSRYGTGTRDKADRHPPSSRDHVDTYCHYCNRFGHPNEQCNFMAQFLQAKEYEKKLDSKAKQDVIDNFVKEQKRRRQRKLGNRMKTVRQLM
jgi:hypothetical protein